MLLKVLIFGYAQGIQSSRKIDRLLERDVAFRYLADNQQPDFHTNSDFRKDYGQNFQHLFVEILRLCRQASMAQMGEVALDGRRVQGDAALDQNRTREQIEEEIQGILEKVSKDNLLETPNLYIVLTRWVEWTDSNKPTQWAEELVKDRKGLFTLIRIFVKEGQHGTISSPKQTVEYLDSRDIDSLIDIEKSRGISKVSTEMG